MTKQEVLKFAENMVSDDDVETIVVVRISKDGSSESQLSAYTSSSRVVYGLAGAMRFVVNHSENVRLGLLTETSPQVDPL